MTKRMLIDATHAEETRVVVVNGTRLEEFDVETSTKKQLKGNIYLAKIVRVEPSLQAAFVDYGGNRHGFLAFSEIHPDYYQIPVADRQALLAEQRDLMRQSSAAASADFGDADDAVEAKPAALEDHDGDVAANAAPVEIAADGSPIIEGEATVVAVSDEGDHQDVAHHDAENHHQVEHVGGEDADEAVTERRRKSLRNYKIQEVIKRRQIVLVQVVKEERGNKGAALTTYLSLAGRYCVLMPNTARGGGVSRKITNAADRKRLKTIANELEIPDGMAVIVRTAGSERTKPEIKRDYEYLLRLWDSVRSLTLNSTAPALVYEEANLIKRSIRDLYSRDIDEILVDGEEGYRLAKDFMRMLTPSHARRVQLFRETVPLLHKFQVEAQLDAMHSPVVQLRSGGYLVINQTEALVAIDVNSGRSTKERHIEETALKTNLEASDEVARQLRLRDLAGLIVIDFIDMEETRNNHQVERRLKEAMRFDRARIQLGKISPFGLMELSRQRLRPSLMETSFQPCPHCGGTGMVRSVESASVHILRVIEEEGLRRRSSEITVTVHPSIALYILNQKRSALAEIEATYGFHVLLAGDETLIPPAYRIDRVKAENPIELPQVAKPINADLVIEDEIEDEVVEEEVEETPAKSEEASVNNNGEENGEGRRRRRRRRRRGRRDDFNGTDENGEGEENGVDAEDVAEASADAEAEGDDAGEEGDSVDLADGDAQPRRRRRGKRGGRRRNRNAAGELVPIGEVGEDGEILSPADEESVDVIIDAIGEAVDALIDTVHSTRADLDNQAEALLKEKAEIVAAEEAQAQLAVPEADAGSVAEQAAVTEDAAKPKRTRAPRKKAEPKEKKAPAKSRAKKAVAEEPASDVAPVEGGETAEEAPKPKRTRAPRKKVVKAEDAPAVDVVAEAPVVEASSPVAETPVAETPVADAPAAVEPVSTEPSAPTRRGWWSRS